MPQSLRILPCLDKTRQRSLQISRDLSAQMRTDGQGLRMRCRPALVVTSVFRETDVNVALL